MRIVVFGPDRRVGAWEGDRIVDLGRASAGRLPAGLAALIAGGRGAIEAARVATDRAIAAGDAASVFDRAAIRLHAPCVDRPRIACPAGNYAKHTLGSAERRGVDASAALKGLIDDASDLTTAAIEERTRERGRLRGFWKDFALPAGPDGDITYPARAERFDYEGELAVMLGSAAKDVPAERGASYVWGVTLLNDWSIRGDGVADKLSFNLSKNFDGGASVGPAVFVSEDDPIDLGDIDIETRVNGELRQSYNTREMIFTFAEFIEYLSRDLTLLPGDLVSGGSGAGTATDATKRQPDGGPSLYLKAGDVVEVSSPRIGTLRNRIVAKTA